MSVTKRLTSSIWIGDDEYTCHYKATKTADFDPSSHPDSPEQTLITFYEVELLKVVLNGIEQPQITDLEKINIEDRLEDYLHEDGIRFYED